MPVSTQLASESTVNVLSRCLQLSSLGHGLGRAEQGRGRRRGTACFPRADALRRRCLCWPSSQSSLCQLFIQGGDRLLESPIAVTLASKRASIPSDFLCLGCSNKIAQARQLRSHRNLFLSALEIRSPRSRRQHGHVLVRALFLPSHCVLTWWQGRGCSGCVCGGGVSFIRALIPFMRAPLS